MTVNEFVVTAGTRIVATWAFILGVVFTLGGPERLMGPTFSAVAQVPGAPATWGVPLAALGLLTLLADLVRSRRPAVLGLYAIAVWSMAIGVGFVQAVLNDPHAAVTGPFTYGLIVALSVLFATGHRRPSSARRRRKENHRGPSEAA